MTEIVSRTRGSPVNLVVGKNHIGGNHKLTHCAICQQEFEHGPHEIIVQHRVDGINMDAVCDRQRCWEAMGRKMAEGK